MKVALFDSKGHKMSIAQDILELKEKEQTFIFEGLNEKPILSLLRGFSAPVHLEQELSSKKLLFLLRYEVDGYAKWNAGQDLILQCFSQWFQLPPSQWQIPQDLISAFHHVLSDDSLDFSLTAALLTLPGFEEVAVGLKPLDVDKVEAVRKHFHKALGLSLYDAALSKYQDLWQVEEHKMNSKAYGRRALRNVCLDFMMQAKQEETLGLCQQQFAKAKTMTDQIASFSLLVNCTDEAERSKAIEAFYRQWSKEELVLDKWFSIQASSVLPDALKKVKQCIDWRFLYA
jgi:aminopeptidase N